MSRALARGNGRRGGGAEDWPGIDQRVRSASELRRPLSEPSKKASLAFLGCLGVDWVEVE